MSAQTKSKEPSSGKPQSRRHLSNKSFFEGEQSRKDPFSTNQVGSGSFFQPRLQIHSGYDFHEAEADRIADQVVATPSVTPAVQQKMAGDPKQDKGLASTITPLRTGHTPQRLPAFFSPSELDTNSAQESGDIQANSENAINGIGTLAWQPTTLVENQEEDSDFLTNESGQFQTESNYLASAPDSDFKSRLQANKSGGSPLTEPIRAEMEKGFGTDFSGVRLHTDSEAIGMNKQLQAHAFTHGSDIYFNEGQYQPYTSEGKHLIAHELTHTVQQGATLPLEPTEQEQQRVEGTIDNELISSAAPVVIPETDPNPEDKAEEVASELANAKQEAVTDEATESENSTPRSPEEDPNFQAVAQNAKETAEHQQRHNPPEAEAASAQAAAPVASNEVMGAAQANQVEAMNEQEPNEFDAAGFKTKLMERIAAMKMPQTLEQADNFEKHSNINDINQAANQDVGTAQANAAGPIDSATQAEPNTGVVPEREVVDLPAADIGATPDSIGANSAMPAPRPDSEVSQPLQEKMGKVDDVMSENEVTDNMLANSNEPSFTGALAQTNEARAHTESAPQGLREEEGYTLGNAQRNSENQSNSQLQNMQTDREGIIGTLTNQQTQTATQDTSERTRIASEIDAIYNKAKTDVERILDDLETKVSEKFTAASDRAKKAFEKHVADEMRAYKNKRYGGWIGKGKWLKDKAFGMPDAVNAFFTAGRQVFIDHMDTELTVISEYVAQQLNAAKDRIAQGRQEVADYVAELPENLQSIGKEAADAIQDQFDSLQDSVNEKQDALIESLAQQYSSALEEVDARIEEMKAENAGLIDAVMGAIKAIIETIINIKNMLFNLLAKAVQAIGTIISDPIGFLTNLFAGIKLGFEQFGNNILKHLQAGFLTWLTGAMSGVSLQMPDDIFSLKGIFSLTSQILGFTWDRVRAIGVKVIGEPIIKALEVGFDIVMILKNEGIAGLWEYIKDQFNDLKETVMNAIMDMLQSQVIQAGIKWILGLLSPVGAFIKACMAIIDVVVFFVQKAKQIIELIDAFLDAILAVV